jgi:flagellar hook-length control protein FliK
MRTDNLTNSSTQSTSSTTSVRDINLSNQLLSAGGSSQSFNQILSSQVQSSSAQPADSRADQQALRREEANAQAPSGKTLPERDRAEQARSQQSRSEDRRAENQRAQADQARDDRIQHDRASQQREVHGAQADRVAQSQRVKAEREKAGRDEPSVDKASADAQSSAPNATVMPAEKEAEIATKPEMDSNDDSKIVAEQDTAQANPLQLDADIESVSAPIVVSPELLAKHSEQLAKHSEQLNSAENPEVVNDSAATPLADQLTEEELLALAQETANVGPLEGEGFLDLSEAKVINEEGADSHNMAAALVAEQAVVAGQSIDPDAVAQSPGEVTRARADTGLSSLAGAARNADKDAAALVDQSSEDDAFSESDAVVEHEPWELKADKKLDVTMMSEKLAGKAGQQDVVTQTPVQERLAALAKAVDKASTEAAKTGSNAKTVEAADATKASPFQRSLEQMGRASASAAKPVATSIATPMQSREWAGEVGQRLIMMVSSKLQSAQIQLNPRDMGPIDVKVALQQDQANVVFTSNVVQTREALEQALPKLREMMEQNGVAMGDVDVRDHDARHSQQNQDHDQQRNGNANHDDLSADDNAVEQVVAQAVGLVDYYA